MYSVTSAVGVKFGINKAWQVIDLSTITLKELYAVYRKVWLTLVPAVDAAPVYLNLDDVRNQASDTMLTVAAYLTALGSASLPVQQNNLVIKHRTAKYRDAFQAGYTLTPVTRANSDSASIAIKDKTDIRLTRESPVTDYMAFFKSCLVSINGFYHLADTDGVNGVVIADAMTSLRHSQQNQIGLYSFNTVCQFDTIRITPSMVQHTAPAQVIVTLPQDLTDKSVMLVLGGYLHAVDPLTLIRVSETAYRIDFDNLPMLERYYESKKYLNLDSLPLDTTTNNTDQTTLASLKSEDGLLAYLLLSQTFFVVLDCPEIYAQKQFVKRAGMPDMYLAYSEPQYPLVMELGRHPEYWSTREDGQYSITVYDNVVGNKVFNTVTTPTLLSVDGVNQSITRGHVSAAYFLELGRDI